LLRAADHAGLAVDTAQVHRPTLDDVFLTLTGRSLREAENATATTQTTQKEAA
jgi:ABC-2 type transport system ATP-binding protein